MAPTATLLMLFVSSVAIFASPITSDTHESVLAFPNEPQTSYYERSVALCNDNCSTRGLQCAQYCIDGLGRTGEGRYCLLKCSAASLACGNQVSARGLRIDKSANVSSVLASDSRQCGHQRSLRIHFSSMRTCRSGRWESTAGAWSRAHKLEEMRRSGMSKS
jgi:hypothetical protein